MSRFREFLSDRWFDLLLWLRYDFSWRFLGVSVGVAIVPVFVATLVSPFTRDFAGGSPDAAPSPVTLPVESPDPLSAVPLRAPVLEVLVIGDSLVAGEEEIYREALDAAGVSSRFDAVVSRGLRYGWLCPSGARAPDASPEDDARTGDGLSDGFPDGDFPVDVSDDDAMNDDAPGDPAAEVAPEESGSDPVAGVGEKDGSAGDGSGGALDDSTSSSGCVRQGLEALSWHAASGSLPAAVVVALGTNDASSPSRQVLERLDTLRVLLEDRPVFLLETATYPMTAYHAGWNDTARTWCLADVSCRFVDWAGAPAPAEFFGPDGVHLNVAGSRARAAALVSVLASGY